jgi:Ca2+/H+ antiporter
MDDKEKGDDDDDDEPKEKKEPNDPFADGFGPYLNHSLDELFNPWKSPMNWLLLCTPFAYYGHHYGGDDVTVFILSVLAIAPMAERVSYVTEQLAMHTSETIGGLLNATFGNVTELIVSLVALFGGMLRIVQVSLLGSILSNLLLVLGCAFLVGGLKYPEQKYSHKAQTLSFGLLLLAVLCIAMPTVLEITHDVEYPEHSSLDVSRSMSLMMIVTYYLYLVFRKRGSQAVNARRAVNDHRPRWHCRAAAAAPALLRRSAAWCPVLGCLGPLGPPTWPFQSPTRPSHSALPLGLPYWSSLLALPIREP